MSIQPRKASHPQFSYRIRQLDTLKAKTSEEERLEEINKQIYNLQNMKQVIYKVSSSFSENIVSIFE